MAVTAVGQGPGLRHTCSGDDAKRCPTRARNRTHVASIHDGEGALRITLTSIWFSHVVDRVICTHVNERDARTAHRRLRARRVCGVRDCAALTASSPHGRRPDSPAAASRVSSGTRPLRPALFGRQSPASGCTHATPRSKQSTASLPRPIRAPTSHGSSAGWCVPCAVYCFEESHWTTSMVLSMLGGLGSAASASFLTSAHSGCAA